MSETHARLPRGLGHIPDSPDARDYPARHLFGAARNLPGESSLEDHLRGINDQGATSSCVGQGVGRGIDTRLRKLGIYVPEPSYLGIYTVGRAWGRFSPDTALVDEGCMPRDAMKGIKSTGVPEESVWPFDEAKVNEDLPWDAMQAAGGWTVSNWYRIDSLGQGRIDGICQAIAAGYPVPFGTEIDRAFMDFTGKSVVGPQGDSVGGHMMCCVGYTTSANGERIFRIVNSWGTGWGDRGMFWASEAFMRDVRTSDLYVIQCNGV